MIEMSIIYAACVAGALGLILLLPNRKNRWGLVGAVLAAGALGAGLLAVGGITTAKSASATASGPGFFFYVLAFIACAGAVRLITHQRPVYAALYFILVVLSTAGLFLMLSAEFMAFALIIVYAGAILVTYLFVIMLAQEEPQSGETEALTEYDADAREPVAASVIAFALLACLLGVMYRGTADKSMLTHQQIAASSAITSSSDMALASMSLAVEQGLRDADLINDKDHVIASNGATRSSTIKHPDGSTTTVQWPKGLTAQNVDNLGMSLLAEFPGCLEVAAVILMLAMIGAVLMARKPAEGLEDEDEALAAAVGAPIEHRISTLGRSIHFAEDVKLASGKLEVPKPSSFPVTRDGRGMDRMETQPIHADRTDEPVGAGASSVRSTESHSSQESS